MVINGARSSRVPTRLSFGPTLFNLFLINIPKDDIKSSAAVSADAVLVAQHWAVSSMCCGCSLSWAECHISMIFPVCGKLPPQWDNSGGVQGKAGSHVPHRLSLHPISTGGSGSHVSIGKHSGGHSQCTSEREQGDFWPCQRTWSSCQRCHSSIPTPLHCAKPGLCAVWLLGCGLWGVRWLSPAKTSACRMCRGASRQLNSLWFTGG